MILKLLNKSLIQVFTLLQLSGQAHILFYSKSKTAQSLVFRQKKGHFNTEYRGSPFSAVSISAVHGIVRLQISTR